MVRGETKNVAITPSGYKNAENAETVIPQHTDLRNGYMTDFKNYQKRQGREVWKDLGVAAKIVLLIPIQPGYAVLSNGDIYRLDTKAKLTTSFTGEINEATWDVHGDKIIICGGQGPAIKIEDFDSSELDGAPAGAKFVGRISTYTLMCGHTASEVKFSLPGNPEDWSSTGSGDFNVKSGETIKNFKVLREKAYIFKERSIEVWAIVGGGAIPFVRQEGAWITRGVGEAGGSVVEAEDTFYWLGSDLQIYRLEGASPKVVSTAYSKVLKSLTHPEDVLAIDFSQDHLIRWLFPTDGKCIVYDYAHKIFWEDNEWSNGQWKRMNINAYMEMDGKQYTGCYDPDGEVSEWSKDYYTDNGRPIRVYRRFSFIASEKGNNYKYNKVGFRFNRGLGDNDTPNPVMNFRYKLDQGPWSTAQDIPLGSSGDFNPWVFTHNLGVGRELEVETFQTDAVPHIMTNMNFTARELGN
jgi:WD40 repeat protein